MAQHDDLPQRLRSLRADRGDDQAVVAEAVGISRSHLANLEAGRDNPGREVFIALAAHYGVSLDWLSTGEGQMRPEHAAALNEGEALLLYAYRQFPPDEALTILKLLLARIKTPTN